MMGFIGVQMDVKDTPAEAVDLAENGAGAADQPAVYDLLFTLFQGRRFD